MKAFKLLSVVFALFVVAGFTSCLDDDDDNDGLTPSEISQCFQAIRGTHQGNLIYTVRNENNTEYLTDTLDIEWSVNSDTTLTISSFPTRLLATYISDNIMKEALTAASNQDINCGIEFLNSSPVQFLINPKAPSYKVNYNGSECTVQIAFYTNNYASFGSYDISKDFFEMQIVAGAVYVNGQLTQQFQTLLPFIFEAK